MTHDEIVAALLAWMEAERVRYLGLLAGYGVPPTRAIPELVALEPEEGRIKYHHVMLNVSPFALEGGVPPEMLAGGEHAPAPPAILHEQYGDRCDVWML